MEALFDTRSKCVSLMTKLTVREYIELVKDSHAARGSLDGQRSVLTTTSAKRIRERMLSDIVAGAVLPPVVIGLVVDPADMPDSNVFEEWDVTDLREFVTGLSKANAAREPQSPDAEDLDEVVPSLSIIDGMQRTAAIIEASEADDRVLDHEVRVEFWVAEDVRALVYRMLVLNTGQIPWDINRQISVVFAPLLSEIKNNVQGIIKISTPDNKRRRFGPGQYSSQHLVELYIAFSLRKTSVDTRESVSDEFSRLDFVENVSNENFQAYFYKVFEMLVALDHAFCKYDAMVDEQSRLGRQIFDSQPARIGFMVALAVEVLGRPGADRSDQDKEKRLARVRENFEVLRIRLDSLDHSGLQDFMRLDVLNEVLKRPDRRAGQVGRLERSIFLEAFKVLNEDSFDVANMEPCWRAG